MIEIIKDEWTDKLKEYFSFDLSKSVGIVESQLDSMYNLYFSELDKNDLKNKPFPKNFLDKVHIKINEEDLYVRNNKNSYLKLEISSWIGISPGAKHYYGTLKISDLELTHNYNEKGSSCSLGNKNREELPQSINLGNSFKIIIKRPMTTKDIRFNKDKYYSYTKGELIKDFWSIKSLKEEGKKLQEKFFPEYKLKIKYD